MPLGRWMDKNNLQNSQTGCSEPRYSSNPGSSQVRAHRTCMAQNICSGNNLTDSQLGESLALELRM
jgi:hypothetical protein